MAEEIDHLETGTEASTSGADPAAISIALAAAGKSSAAAVHE